MRKLSVKLSILVGLSALAVPLPALAAEACNSLGLVDTLALQRLPNGWAATIVKIAGSPRTMLIDTGGAYSAVTQKTVQDLKLTEMRNPGNRGIKMINGSVTDMLARLPLLEIGQRMRQENALYYILPAPKGANPRPEVFDGILSGELLKNYDADFDFDSQKLNLFSQDHCPGNVVYWKSPIVATVPFSLDDANHIVFPMELDGTRINAMLDTGAFRTALDLTVAERRFNVDTKAPDTQKVGEITGGFTASVYRRKFKTLAVDGVIIQDPEIDLVPGVGSAPATATRDAASLLKKDVPDLLLGMSSLRQLHVYIAYKERKLYMTASANPPAAPPQAVASAQPQRAAQGQGGQGQGGGFCPSPSEAVAQPVASPDIEAGMTAFRNRNFRVAYANLKPLADMGTVEAMRDIGLVLRQSCGRNADKTAAAAWLQKAADAADIQAAAALGDMYEFGDGVAKDEAGAFKWLTLAANAGQRVAQADLGELYFTGSGVALDRYQGVVWSVRAGEDGAPLALFRIGREYANGQVLPKDNAKAALYMTAGIARLPAGRRPEFQPALDNLGRQMSGDALNQAKQSAQMWMPGPSSLAQVLADADAKRGPTSK
jgi:TPR repeat protein/predicted aspartyl protease